MLNWIVWNGTIFDIETVKLFEIELIICIKMDLTLNNLQLLICHKTQTTNQPHRSLKQRNQTIQLEFLDETERVLENR